MPKCVKNHTKNKIKRSSKLDQWVKLMNKLQRPSSARKKAQTKKCCIMKYESKKLMWTADFSIRYLYYYRSRWAAETLNFANNFNLFKIIREFNFSWDKREFLTKKADNAMIYWLPVHAWFSWRLHNYSVLV